LANNANAKRTEKVTIAGKCCESGDILLNDTMMPEIKVGDILATVRGKLLFAGLMGKVLGGKKGGKPAEAMGFEITPDMMGMMNGFTVLRLVTLMGSMMEGKLSKEMLLDLNAQLNKIKKPKK